MRRLASLFGMALLLVLPAAGARAATPAPKARRPPNIVVIVVDTLRADRLPFYGYSKPTAPFLARIAEESAVFDRALSTSSKTAPAAASLFSSLYPDHHGVLLGRLVTRRLATEKDAEITLNRIPAAVDTLGEVMKRAGYSTWALSDNYNVCEDMGFAQGFDRFVSERSFNRGAGYVNGVLRGWRKEMLARQPYFLYLHYMEPHSPYLENRKWYRFDPAGISLTGADGRPVKPEEATSRARAAARYDSEIGMVDSRIEEVFRHFGWDRNTLLIFTADHGEEFHDHGGESHGRTLFEEVVRIPLFFHDSSGRFLKGRIPEAVSLVDLLPTLTEIAGAEHQGFRHGRSLVPLLTGAPAEKEPARSLFAQVEGYPYKEIPSANRRVISHFVVRAVFSGGWKLIDDSRTGVALFRPGDDPAERFDLAERNPEVVADLARQLAAFVAQAKAFDPESFVESLSPDDLRKLRSLGYVE
jgi:arylsulfatase A-like enzyme